MAHGFVGEGAGRRSPLLKSPRLRRIERKKPREPHRVRNAGGSFPPRFGAFLPPLGDGAPALPFGSSTKWIRPLPNPGVAPNFSDRCSSQSRRRAHRAERREGVVERRGARGRDFARKSRTL